MEYAFTALKRYAEFSGRSRRLEYGMFLVVVFLISIILVFIDMQTGMFAPDSGLGLLSSLFSLAVMVPGIAVGVRRLHDINASGWWYLLILIPLVNVVLVLFLLFKQGMAGANRFGPDPKAM